MSGYGFSKHAGKVFTPDGANTLTEDTVDQHNAELERRELASWAGKPDRALGYYKFEAEYQSRRDLVAAGGINHYRANFSPRIKGATVSTWLGTELGKITEARVYRHNFGARFVSLRVLGTNGAEYWGRASWDGGNAVILRKVRGVR